MLSWIPLTALLAVGLSPQEPAAAVAPLLGENVIAVGHVDLSKADAPALVRRLVGKLADETEIAGLLAVANGWTGAMKAAGAKDLFVLIDLIDMPGIPVLVVPLTGGADGKAIAGVLSGAGPNLPFALPASETIRGSVVAGTAAAVARIRGATPVDRPELAEALADGGGAAVQIVLMPSPFQRRAIEESMADLPPELGGGPVTTVTRGLKWLSMALEVEPRTVLRAVLQASDAGAAEDLAKMLRGALNTLADAGRNDPSMAALATALGRIEPEVKGGRVTFEADLEKSAELLAIPFLQAREAARRSQCTNNLKQIGLAMHNYHSGNNNFPPAYTAGADGKPLLSWRVHILPYLEADNLYKEFHLDEPWDSPHNKALIPRMPRTYLCPSAPPASAREGKTTYVTLRGPGTMFPGSQGVKIQEITDGTSNTIMVADAGDESAVTWTKPDDWGVSPEFTTKGLFGRHPGGSNFGFADGSVRFLKETITPKLLRNLSTRNGGELISADEY